MNPGNDKKRKAKKSLTFIKLEKWMDHLGIMHFSFINTFDFPGKPTLKHVNFDYLQTACNEYDKVLALGNFASDALKKINVKHFLMPHPSPLNRKLNDKQFEMQMLRECIQYLK